MDFSKKQISLLVSLALTIMSIIFVSTMTFYNLNMGILGNYALEYSHIAYGAAFNFFGDQQIFEASIINQLAYYFLLLGLFLLLAKLFFKPVTRTKEIGYLGFIVLFISALIFVFSKEFIVQTDPDATYNIETLTGVTLTFVTTLLASFGFLISEVIK